MKNKSLPNDRCKFISTEKVKNKPFLFVFHKFSCSHPYTRWYLAWGRWWITLKHDKWKKGICSTPSLMTFSQCDAIFRLIYYEFRISPHIGIHWKDVGALWWLQKYEMGDNFATKLLRSEIAFFRYGNYRNT